MSRATKKSSGWNYGKPADPTDRLDEILSNFYGWAVNDSTVGPKHADAIKTKLALEQWRDECLIEELEQAVAHQKYLMETKDKEKLCTSYHQYIKSRLVALRSEDLDPSIQKLVNKNFQNLIWKVKEPK